MSFFKLKASFQKKYWRPLKIHKHNQLFIRNNQTYNTLQYQRDKKCNAVFHCYVYSVGGQKRYYKFHYCNNTESCFTITTTNIFNSPKKLSKEQTAVVLALIIQTTSPEPQNNNSSPKTVPTLHGMLYCQSRECGGVFFLTSRDVLHSLRFVSCLQQHEDKIAIVAAAECTAGHVIHRCLSGFKAPRSCSTFVHQFYKVKCPEQSRKSTLEVF